MEIYPFYAMAMDTRLMEYGEKEKNISMKKQRCDYDRKSSSHGGSMEISKPLGQGQYASGALLTSI